MDTARVMQACQLLKSHGFEDIAGWLANLELSERKEKRNSRPRGMRVVYQRTGKEITIDERIVKRAIERDRLQDRGRAP